MSELMNFRSDATDLIDLVPVAEAHHFSSIYDELLFEVSHNDPDYIDPAVMARALSNSINERFYVYYEDNRKAFAEFQEDMQRILS